MTGDPGDLSPEGRAWLTTELVRRGQLSHPMSLVAHVETSASPETIRAALAEALPAYMVPDQIVTSDSLPRLPNGKLDTGTLRHLTESAAPKAAGPSPDTAPASLETLRAIWADTLGTDQIFDSDDFFEMGGDSLLSISLVSRARREGLNIVPSDLFDYPRLEDLARKVSQTAPETLADIAEGPLDLSAGGAAPQETTGLQGQIVFINTTRRIMEFLDEALGGRYQIHMLTMHWDSGEISPRARVEDIAEDFTCRVKDLAPEGPYLLGGFSFGGVVSMEIARRLVDEGAEVQKLLLIDPPENPALFAGVHNPDHRYEVPQDEVLTLRRRVLGAAVRAVAGGMRWAGLPLPKRLRRRLARSAYFYAAARYQPQMPVAPPIIVRRRRADPTTMWARTGEHAALLEIDSPHDAFHRDDTTIREWTAKLAHAIRSDD